MQPLVYEYWTIVKMSNLMFAIPLIENMSQLMYWALNNECMFCESNWVHLGSE